MRLPVAIVLAAVLLVAGCDSGTDEQTATPAPAPTFNDTDVTFVRTLIPHHTRGVEIVGIGADRTNRPEVKVLANAIEATQREEITRMSGWLGDWKQSATPAATASGAATPGATTEAQVAALREHTGKEFDRAFFALLIAHQKQAVQIAQQERAGGANLHAKAFAAQVEASRTAQIRQLTAWLDES